MAKPRNSYEILAQQANERVAKVRDAGQQLQLLPDEAGVTVEDAAKGKVGRPKGAQNKGSSELRKWLAAQGLRMPEDVLAEMAGLGNDDPVVVQAIDRTEALLAWAFADAVYAGGDDEGKPRVATPEQRISLAMQMLALIERAAAAMLPYGTPKASPDVAVQQNVQVVMAGAPTARDVTPATTISSGRMMPADVAAKMQRKQRVTISEDPNSDDESRTE